nr:hypothetical protein Iba_chr08aCG11500 [Ipomoea batatas]
MSAIPNMKYWMESQNTLIGSGWRIADSVEHLCFSGDFLALDVRGLRRWPGEAERTEATPMRWSVEVENQLSIAASLFLLIYISTLEVCRKLKISVPHAANIDLQVKESCPVKNGVWDAKMPRFQLALRELGMPTVQAPAGYDMMS